MMCNVRGSQVETNIPDWLLNSAATYTGIEYVRKLACELARDPDAYGFDVGSVYTVFVQTWDSAISSVPSLAFGRSVVGQEQVELIPDIYYIHSLGYRDHRVAAERAPAWREREPVAIWRGSVTGRGPYADASEIPRVRLALACRDNSHADVAIFDVHSTMAGVFSPDAIRDFIARERLTGDRWPLDRYGQYRFAIDIDGHANAWGLLEKLIYGCCVLKVQSPYEQWYYDRLQPWVHYVPVAADLSDLADRIDWCLAHPERSEWIARNGALLAASLAIDAEVPRSCLALMKAAQSEQLVPAG